MIWILLNACGDEESIDSGKTSPENWEWPDSAEPEAELQEVCEVEILEVVPAAGEEEVFFQTPIEVVLDGLDETATLEILGPEGSIDGELEVLSPWEPAEESDIQNEQLTLLRFVPEALIPSSEHSIVVSYCNDTEGETTTFSTSDWGVAVGTSIVGNTYAMTLKEGDWVVPPGAGPLVGTLFQNHLLLSVSEQDSSELDMELGISIDDAYQQDYCFPTINSLPNVVFGNPEFNIPQSNLQMVISGYSVAVYDMEITGVFRSDGQSYGHGVLKGRFDARDIELTVAPDADQLCQTVEILGTACEPCPDGLEYCFPVRVEGLSGEVTQNDLECVASANCHPNCASSTCASTQLGACEF